MEKQTDLSFLKYYLHLFEKSEILEEIVPRKFKDCSELEKLASNHLKFGKECVDLESLTKGFSEPMYDLLDRGGKRWRPILILIISECFGRNIENLEENKDIYLIAGLVEIVHNASLMVDDIEDKSTMRRGAPCTFLKYGVDIALNTGNFMYFIPMLLTQRFFKDDKETLLKLLEIYHEEMVIIHLGQNWDINWHNNDYIPTEEQYLQMVAFKTGVLPRMALRMCTHILGLNESLQEAFFNFAQNIGIAFQIQDDIINLESEEFAKGKEILGEDIYEGKKTLMIIHAMQKSEKKERLQAILKLKTNNTELITEAINILKESGSLEYAKTIGNKFISEAWDEIKPHLPKSKQRKMIKSFTFHLFNRKT